MGGLAGSCLGSLWRVVGRRHDLHRAVVLVETNHRLTIVNI